MDRFTQRNALTVTQVAFAFKFDVLAFSLRRVVAKIAQILRFASQLLQQCFKLLFAEAVALFDHGCGAFIVSAQGFVEALFLGGREFDALLFEQGIGLRFEAVEVFVFTLGEHLLQRFRRVEKFAVFLPEFGIGQLFDLGTFEIAQRLHAESFDLVFERSDLIVDPIAQMRVDRRHRVAKFFIVAQSGDIVVAEFHPQTLGAFDGDFVVAEILVVEDFGGDGVVVALLPECEVAVNFHDMRDILGAKFTVFVAEIFAEFAVGARSVDELHFAAAVRGFGVGEDPDVGGDTGVVEEVVG